MSKLEALLELEKRGKLPPEYKGALEEARKRGLVPGATGEAFGPPMPPKSVGQKIKENLLGDNDPTTQNFGEKVGTFLNKAGESMTFGLVGDEASAALESVMPGVDYGERRDHYRDQEALLEKTNPGAALTADIGGAVVGAMVPVGATLGTLGQGARLAPRIGASAATGAGMGGTYGFMEGEGQEDRLSQMKTGAKIGGAVGVAAPIVGAGVKKVADAMKGNAAIKKAVAAAPTSDALRAEGRALYDAIDNAGVQIRPDRVQGAMDDIAGVLKNEGAGYTGAEKVMPASRAILDATSDVAKGANTVPFKELDMFRRYMGNAAGSNLQNAGDTRAATQALSSLDDFVRGLDAADVDAGDVKTLQTLLPKARDTWARMSRSQLLDDAMENAANYRTGEASGLRAQFQRIVNNPKLSRGFSDAEIKMMRRVVNGTLPEQIVNYLGSGLGMLGQMGGGAALGAMSGGPLGALVGGAAASIPAAGSRKLSESMVRRNAEIARALVASGGVPQLPKASESYRAVTEALMRRGGAAVPQ